MTMAHTQRFVRFAALMTAVALLAGCSYNKFTAKEEEIKAQWAQVENQLQRRNDLIPNLVETVKGVAQQEQTVFGAIADARARMSGAQTPTEKIAAANAETTALGRLFVVVENYPQLRSNEQFARLMDELSGTENRLSVERMRYNDRVREFDTMRRQFPSNITAKIFSYKEYPYFEAPAEAKAVPKVDFKQ
jgi:LemA protein